MIAPMKRTNSRVAKMTATGFSPIGPPCAKNQSSPAIGISEPRIVPTTTLKDRSRSPSSTISPLPRARDEARSEEHTSDLQLLMRPSFAVFCVKKKTQLESLLYIYLLHYLHT